MAFRLQIKGNFFIVNDYATRTDIIRRRPGDINYIRMGDYFAFTNAGQIIQVAGTQGANILGGFEKLYEGAPDPIRQNVFKYSDCEDNLGVTFPSADNMDDWLASNIGQEIILQTLDPNVDHLDFVQTPSVGGAVRRLLWNDTDKTLDLGLSSNVTLQIGQETNLYVKNESGSTITNGQVVYLTGSTGSNTTVDLADADTISADQTIGVATEDIANNDFGYITTYGLVRNIDTSGLTEGSQIWLSTTAGAIVDTQPTPPTHAVLIGLCVRSHASVGSILVNVQIGAALSELHDTLLSGLNGGDALTYDDVNQYWFNDPLIHTVELINALSEDYYAPYDMSIDAKTAIFGSSPTITLKVNDVAYTLEDPIDTGDKITVTSDVVAVTNLSVTRIFYS